jgi:hypothetical protein
MTIPKTEKWFLVKYGFSIMDRVSIKEDELEKAIYAQKYKIVVQLGSKQINGSNIIVIEPDYRKYTGWNPEYEPKGNEDWIQIKRDCPAELEEVISERRKKIDYLVATGQQKLVGTNVDISTLKSGVKEIGK